MTRITKRQLQKATTRAAILKAAYAIFSEKGYADATMRDLARMAGIGLGTIFQHFPDKASLLVAAYQDDLSQIIKKAMQSLPSSGIKFQLLHLTHHIYSFYASNVQLSRTLLKETLFLEGRHGDILNAQLHEFLQTVRDLFQNAIENGEVSACVDPMTAAYAYGSFYFGVLVTALKEPQFDIAGHLKKIESLIESFIIKRS
jgi:AcrR family transcriptional regulator